MFNAIVTNKNIFIVQIFYNYFAVQLHLLLSYRWLIHLSTGACVLSYNPYNTFCLGTVNSLAWPKHCIFSWHPQILQHESCVSASKIWASYFVLKTLFLFFFSLCIHVCLLSVTKWKSKGLSLNMQKWEGFIEPIVTQHVVALKGRCGSSIYHA